MRAALHQNSRHSPRRLAWPVVLLAIAGCRQELGPERFATTEVVGQIQLGGRPVAGGFIEIQPAPGNRGVLRVGPIRADGSFRLDRVATGPVLIGLAFLPERAIMTAQGPVDARDFGSMAHPIRRTIPVGPRAEIPPIDLNLEAARRRRRGGGRRRKRTTRRVPDPVPPPRKSGGPRPGGAGDRPDGPQARSPQTLTIRVIYRDSGGTVHLDHPPDQLEAALRDPSGTVWVDVEDLDSAHNPEVEALFRNAFRFHPLAIEDALKDVHVPRIDDWGDYLYLVVNTLSFHPATDQLQFHELDLFLGANFLVTYHHEAVEVIDRLHLLVKHKPDQRLKHGPSHILHHILDDVVDHFLPTIEHLDAAIDAAQDEVFDHATSATLRRIFHIKECALKLHRIVTPMREVLNRLARDPYPQVQAEDRVYFRDVYDHLVRVHDIVETLRDLIAGALDTYLSIVSNRTNDIMKVLTLLNVMFLPMTFIAGFFGMNFFGETLMFQSPMLSKALLFWITVGLMIAAPVGMWVMARSRGWF